MEYRARRPRSSLAGRPRRTEVTMPRILAAALALALSLGACAKEQYIPYTRVIDTKQNRELVGVVEAYRHALERKDPAALLAMASPDYFEDSGTPTADDDYGYEGLKQVLARRLTQVESIRYSLQYMKIEVKDKIALVDVYIDASYQLHTAQGTKWDRKQEPHRMELVNDGKRWLFRRGM
jgi:hypothetical protein